MVKKKFDKTVANLRARTPAEFFKKWVGITISFSKLTEKEADFLAALLTKKYELSKVVKDDNILSKLLFDKDSKDEMVTALGMKNIQIWENMASSLRKKGVIKEGNKINPLLEPNIKGDKSKIEIFQLIFNIILEDDDKGQVEHTNPEGGSRPIQD